MEENSKNLKIFPKDWNEKTLKIYSKLGSWKTEENSNNNILGYFRKTKMGSWKIEKNLNSNILGYFRKTKMGSWKMKENSNSNILGYFGKSKIGTKKIKNLRFGWVLTTYPLITASIPSATLLLLNSFMYVCISLKYLAKVLSVWLQGIVPNLNIGLWDQGLAKRWSSTPVNSWNSSLVIMNAARLAV